MILVDTNVWISHFQSSSKRLSELLHNAEVLLHPLIIGEIACGKLVKRSEIIEALQALPIAEVANEDEIIDFIQTQSLFEKGIGIVDVHLLASCRLSKCKLWTLDKKLGQQARRLNISA